MPPRTEPAPRDAPAGATHPPFGWTDLALCSVVVAFALNFRAGQLAGVMTAGERLDARALILLRMLLVVPVLLPVAARNAGTSVRSMLRMRRGEAALFALLGLVGIPGNQFLFLWGMQHTNTIHAAVIFALSPGLAAAIARLAFRERSGPALWVGIAAGFVGVALVVSRSVEVPHAAVRTDAQPTLFGDLLILASACGWGLYNAASSLALRRRRALEVTALALAAGLVWCVLLFGATFAGELRSGAFARIVPAGWGGILYVSYVGALYGWVVWAHGIQRLGPSRTMLYQYLVPVVTMAVGVALLGERLDARAVGGAALVVAGVAVGRRAAGRA